MITGFYDYLDHIANTEIKAQSLLQGSTWVRYKAAVAHGGGSLSLQAAELIQGARAGTAWLVTGAGNPVWLPYGETDGPSGVGVLAKSLTEQGFKVALVAEEEYLPPIVAAVQALGVPVLPKGIWVDRALGAVAMAMPRGADSAKQWIDAVEDVFVPSLVAFVEKPGPNSVGIFHSSLGTAKAGYTVAHAHLIAEDCRSKGIPTLAIGDGGNEVGFGNIADLIEDEHPYGRSCHCPCNAGILNTTSVDVLFPAAVSNWGAYAVAAALCVLDPTQHRLPTPDQISESIKSSARMGALDGYTGLNIWDVDGTSLEANLAIYQLIVEVVGKASKKLQRPF